jgi:RND family efflux transporter MFP subunit
MIKRIFLIALVVIAFYVGLQWFSKDKQGDPSVSANLSVTVVSPSLGVIVQQLSVTGMTIAREEIVVITELSGVRVKEVFADVGDFVKKNQKLAVLDSESLRNQLAQLQSDYDRARDEFGRVNAIKDTGAVSRESVTQKRTAMQAARAKLADAQLNLKRSTIIAPEAGIVFERKAALGALINASEPLFRIVRRGEIEIEASVPEADLQHLKIGQPAVIRLSGIPQPLPGKIRLISPRIEAASRTAIIRIAFPNDHPAPVGLFANVDVTSGETQGIILPATAIQQDNQGSYVWKLDDANRAIKQPIQITQRNGDSVMIENLPTDISIIARAGSFVKEGDVVNVVEEK